MQRDSSPSRQSRDERQGQILANNGSVADTGLPFRVALVWTDKPGPTGARPIFSNLNLSVSVGSSTCEHRGAG